MRAITIILTILLFASSSWAANSITIGGAGDKTLATVGGSKTLTIAGSTGKSMLFTHDASAHVEGYLSWVDASNRTEVYVEFWVRLNHVTGLGNDKGYTIASLRDSNGVVLAIRLNTDGSGNLNIITATTYNDDTTGSTTGAIAPSADTWYQLRAHFKAATGDGNNDGIIQVWFSNMSSAVIDLSNVDNDANVSRTYRLGQIGGSTFTDTGLLIHYDDYKVGSTAGGSDYFSSTWEASTNVEDGWTSKVDTGSALSLDTTVFH